MLAKTSIMPKPTVWLAKLVAAARRWCSRSMVPASTTRPLTAATEVSDKARAAPSAAEPRQQERHEVHDQTDLSREYKRER